jgi:LPS-assembly protein
MTRLPIIVAAAAFSFLLCSPVYAQQNNSDIEIQSLDTNNPAGVWIETRNGIAHGTNGVFINYMGTVLSADSVVVYTTNHEARADGHVHIQQGGQLWVGDHVRYNLETHDMVAEQFRSGRPPVFMEGKGLHGNIVSNRMEYGTYDATNAIMTTDDVEKPGVKIRASRIRITPNQKVQAWNAVLYMGDVPIGYFPYYERNIGPHANNLDLIPGYRSSFGGFILGSYSWYLNEQLEGRFHLDYREKRGVGVGPDFDYHLGRWGQGHLSYYYTHDDDAKTNFINAPVFENRQRVDFSYLAMPYTNLEVRAVARYQNDAGVVRDFFTGEYRQNPQPNTFIEADKLWRNFSLDVLTQPRVNNFLETVERLPDVRLTGFQQQVGASPIYYNSESSVGYYRRLFAETNSSVPIPPNYEAARADTYHQLTLPETFFGWLNITPRAGGRFTYYTEGKGPGGVTEETKRGVFNTGAEVTFKASRVWPGVKNNLLDLDGLRHIVQPSVNYVYVPSPNDHPTQLPQFDYELPSLALLPIEYPEYNSIDSIDSQNVLRFGFRNQLQTKREGRVEDLLDWQLYTDWRLKPRSDQRTWADLYSDLSLAPRSWMTLESQTRLDLNTGNLRLAVHTLTLRPNDVWSWTVGHFYLRDNFGPLPTALGRGADVVTSALFFRVNENWGTRAVHHFDVHSGRLQEQYYALYRDMRSWTAALTGGIRDQGDGSTDYSIVFTFSFKARPKYSVGGDSVRPYSMLGL